MAKFVFELFDGYAETSLFLPISGDPVFLFSPSLTGYVTVGDRAYEVTDGRVSIPISELPVGDFSPELISKNKRWLLPCLVFDGETVSPKPYDDEYIRALSRELHEMSKEIEALIAEAKKIKETVYGKLLF